MCSGGPNPGTLLALTKAAKSPSVSLGSTLNWIGTGHHDALVVPRLAVGGRDALRGPAGPSRERGGQAGQEEGEQGPGAVQKQAAFHGRAD